MSDESTKKKWWKRRWVVWTLWLPFGLFGLICVLIWWLGWNEKRKWEELKADLEAKGEVFELEAYLPREIPDEENVLQDEWFVSLLERADVDGGLHAVLFNVDELRGCGNDYSFIEYNWEGPDPSVGLMLEVAQNDEKSSQVVLDNEEAARQLLLKWENSDQGLKELDRILAFKGMVGNLDEENALISVYPERPSERISLCRFCIHVGLMYGMVGDSSKAIAYLERAEKVKNWESGSFLIDHLIKSSCSGIIQNAVWQLMVTYRDDAKVLDRLGRIIERALSDEDMLTTAMRAEIAFLLEMHRSYDAGEWQNAMFTFDSATEKWLFGRMMVTDFVKYRSMNKKVILTIPHVRDYEQSPTCMPPGVLVERMEESYYDFLDEGNELQGVFNQLSTTGLSSITALANNLIEERAGWQIARVQLAIARYRLENDSEPQGFDDLKGDYLQRIPLDPYDGQPLRWKLDGQGKPMVYSIGRDLEDNGGELGLDGAYGDLAWRMTVD